MSPLTKTIPKSLVPIAGLTVLERLINTLHIAGVKSITVGVGWLGENISTHLQGLPMSERIQCVNVHNYEKGSLETLVCSLEHTTADPFLVCPADYVVEPELVSAFMRSHKESEDDRIMSLAVDPVGKQGSVVIGDRDGGISRFVSTATKPMEALGRSAMLVAGGRDARGTFKKALQEGETTVAEAITKIASNSIIAPVAVEGYWKDIDTVNDMLETIPYTIMNTETPRSSITVQDNDIIEVGEEISMSSGIVLSRSVKIIGPVYIGENSQVDEGAVIGPMVSLGKNTHIPKKCTVVNSILFGSPFLQIGSQIRDAILQSDNLMHGVN